MKSGICIFFIAALASPALAQGNDPELKRIADTRQRALQECNKFREAGGKAGAPNDPARTWSAVFWKYREEHPGTPAAAQATNLALAWMDFSDQNDELIAKTQTLPLDDGAWRDAIDWLRDASRKKGDYAPFYDKARILLRESKDNKLRAVVQLSLGSAYRDQGEPDQAIAAFQAAIQEAPNSVQAEDAQRHLYEMKSLRAGQPVPAFEAKTIDDQRISSADLRGKVVLLNFWASW
jgi:tetratricopeptide (TPR) repeat protein